MNTQERPHIYNHNTGGPGGDRPKSVNTLGNTMISLKKLNFQPSSREQPKHLGGAAEAAITQMKGFQNGIQVRLCGDDPPALSLLQEYVSLS